MITGDADDGGRSYSMPKDSVSTPLPRACNLGQTRPCPCLAAPQVVHVFAEPAPRFSEKLLCLP
jgi:hypothetical protein